MFKGRVTSTYQRPAAPLGGEGGANQRRLQALPNIPWWAKLPLTENH